MFSTFFQPCELKLHLLQNAIFLHPPGRPLPEEHDRPPMANDEIVRGLVELYVPSTRHISGIRVRLKAVQTVAILDPSAGLTPVSWEDSTILEKVVEIGVQSDKFIHHLPAFSHRSASTGPAQSAQSAATSASHRGRSVAAPERSGRSGSSFARRPSSPGGSIPASMARAVSRGRRLATGMGRISHSPSPSNSRSTSRAPSPTPPAASERGRSTATRGPPSYTLAIGQSSNSNSNSSGDPTPGATDNEHDVTDHSLPVSSAATPQHSRRQSLSAAQSPAEERGQPPVYETTEHDSDLAAHLRRSLATHERNDRRSASAAPAGPSSGPNPLQLQKEEEKHKQKSRSSSIGFFASRKARSKSRAPVSIGVGNHGTELDQVTEESARGRRGMEPRQASDPQIANGAVVTTPGNEGETGWVTEANQDGLELQKGVHGFEFAFIIPCDAAPYERSPYGRVRYIIKATAIGAGRAKSNVECWRDLYPMVNPSPDSGPTPLTVLYNDMHPTVGLVSIACTSNNTSVGGVFNIDINSPNPPVDLIVYLVRVSLETTIELHTKRRGKQTVPVQRHKMFEKGWVPPKNNDGSHGDGKQSDGFVRNSGTDHAWTIQGIARMPDDNVIRASTVAASKASICFSHVMVVEIVHSRVPAGSTATSAAEQAKERRLKVFALRQPVLIPSCCCAYDAVTLPAYTAKPDPSDRSIDMPYNLSSFGYHPPASESSSSAHATTSAGGSDGHVPFPSLPGNGHGSHSAAVPNTSTQVHGQSQLFCVCGMSLQDLSAQERALMPTAPLDVRAGEVFRHQGKIGELPPRLDSSRRRSPSTSSSTSGVGIVASLKGRRRSTSSTRTATSGATGVASGSGERRPSITASIQGRSPSIASAFRARRPSNSSTTAGAPALPGDGAAMSGTYYSGGNAFSRADSASRSSVISRISASSNASANGVRSSSVSRNPASSAAIPEERTK